MRRVLFGIYLFVFLACASLGSEVISDLDIPLNALQKVVAGSLPTGRREVSSNDREFTSNYFVPEGDVRFWRKSEAKDKSRFFARVWILGDRRPYNIEVLVIREDLVKSWNDSRPSFKETGYVEPLSKKLAESIRDNLTKSLKDRNVIDDFRAF